MTHTEKAEQVYLDMKDKYQERAEKVYGGPEDRCDHANGGFCQGCMIRRIADALRTVEQEKWEKATTGGTITYRRLAEQYTTTQLAQRTVNLWQDFLGCASSEDYTTDEWHKLRTLILDALRAIRVETWKEAEYLVAAHRWESRSANEWSCRMEWLQREFHRRTQEGIE